MIVDKIVCVIAARKDASGSTYFGGKTNIFVGFTKWRERKIIEFGVK